MTESNPTPSPVFGNTLPSSSHGPLVWAVAILVGFLAAAAALALWQCVEWAQEFFYQSDGAGLAEAVRALPDWQVILIPVLGGLTVGLITKWILRSNRVHGVAEVIEAAALDEGRISARMGIGSALASAVTLSTGGSTGREGPVVHFAAAIATFVSNRLNLHGLSARNLLGCTVAAAVSASFNAPIAGIIFAHEVILRHFALHAFAPIALASVTGAVLNRLAQGNVPEFLLPDLMLGFYEELPAFFLLGLLCGVVAAIVMRTVMAAVAWGDQWQRQLALPPELRPAFAGFILGLMALAVPEIVGVGYDTTSDALSGRIGLWAGFVIVVVKSAAVVVTVAGRMGGGIFSPSLMIGALTGLVFGIVATALFPANSGDETLYALAGMGAVAAAILGAPLSTALIVFEMTGDWQAGIAVLVAVGPAAALASKLTGRSLFHLQLAARGVNLAEGPQQWALLMAHAADIMTPLDHGDAAKLAPTNSPLHTGSTLAQVLTHFEKSGAAFAAIHDQDGEPVGTVSHEAALRRYAEILIRINAEHHG